MSTASLELTIVRDLARYSDYPYVAIDPDVCSLFEHARSLETKAWDQFAYKHTMLLLECYLQLVDRRLTVVSLCSARFIALAKGFLGALSTERFWAASDKRRDRAAREFVDVCLSLRDYNPSAWKPDELIALLGPKAWEVRKYAALFEARKLDAEKVWVWRGWRGCDMRGSFHWIPLLGVYKKLGREFTDRLFRECELYLNSHHHDLPAPVYDLCRFIGEYSKPIKVQDFLAQKFMTSFWREFMVHYFESGYLCSCSSSQVI